MLKLLDLLDAFVLNTKRPVSYILFFGGIILWVLAAKYWAQEEPPFVLGLSFFAIICTGYVAIQNEAIERRRRKDES